MGGGEAARASRVKAHAGSVEIKKPAKSVRKHGCASPCSDVLEIHFWVPGYDAIVLSCETPNMHGGIGAEGF